MNTTDLIEQPFLRTDLPEFRPGDTVKVHVRVVEGNRERVQVFQGVVIGRSGGGVRETFRVRKISFGIGVERTFPLHSPSIAKLELVQRGRVRRAKLYYLRDLRGKKARIKERRIDDAKLAAMEASAAEAAARAEAEALEAADEAGRRPAEDAVEPLEVGRRDRGRGRRRNHGRRNHGRRARGRRPRRGAGRGLTAVDRQPAAPTDAATDPPAPPPPHRRRTYVFLVLGTVAAAPRHQELPRPGGRRAQRVDGAHARARGPDPRVPDLHDARRHPTRRRGGVPRSGPSADAARSAPRGSGSSRGSASGRRRTMTS